MKKTIVFPGIVVGYYLLRSLYFEFESIKTLRKGGYFC